MRDLTEPSADQCSENALVFEDKSNFYYAAWYPQMGGYVGKCIVEIPKNNDNECFEIYIWHDGEFPFVGQDGNIKQNPYQLHHCNAEQFITFGRLVSKLIEGEKS